MFKNLRINRKLLYIPLSLTTIGINYKYNNNVYSDNLTTKQTHSDISNVILSNNTNNNNNPNNSNNSYITTILYHEFAKKLTDEQIVTHLEERKNRGKAWNTYHTSSHFPSFILYPES